MKGIFDFCCYWLTCAPEGEVEAKVEESSPFGVVKCFCFRTELIDVSEKGEKRNDELEIMQMNVPKPAMEFQSPKHYKS